VFCTEISVGLWIFHKNKDFSQHNMNLDLVKIYLNKLLDIFVVLQKSWYSRNSLRSRSTSLREKVTAAHN